VFELKNKDAPVASNETGKPMSGNKGVKSGDLATRQTLQAGNDANIDALNRGISQQRAGLRQAQPGDSASNQPPVGFRANTDVWQQQDRANPGYRISGGYAAPNANPDISNAGRNGMWNGNPGVGGPGGGNQFGNQDFGGLPPMVTGGSVSGNLFNNNTGMMGGFNLPNGAVVITDGMSSTFAGNAVNGVMDLAVIQDREENDFGIAEGAGGVAAAAQVGSGMRLPPGGLSLGFDLPTTGRKLVFTKTGGDPKLALSVRPQESIRWGLTLVWTIVCIGLGAAVALAVRGKSATARLTRQFPIAIAAIGVLGFIVLPVPLNACSFVVFVAASIFVGWINRDVTGTA
jgi:hypothetical protein